MSAGFVVSLAVVVLCVVAARLLFGWRVLGPWARPITRTDATLVVVGVLGLAFHCAAMFFRDWVDVLPGTDGMSSQIRDLGVPSGIWYVVPSALVMLGLRRINRIALALVGLLLAAVGFTMYDGGSLDVHLASIFALVVALAAVVSTSVLPPRAPSTRAATYGDM